MVIVTGTGEKSFSAGFDVGDVANAEEVGPKGQTTWSRVNRFPKPIIAATNGSALDGGCEPALACHFRIMVDKPKALIGLSELNFGIIPGWGGTQRMLRTLGRSKALDMILFSKRITAKEALSIELIDKVSAPGEALNDALQMAQVIAERLPHCSERCTESDDTAGLNKGADEGLRVEMEGIKAVSQSKDVYEGFIAFLEKRKPVFKGE